MKLHAKLKIDNEKKYLLKSISNHEQKKIKFPMAIYGLISVLILSIVDWITYKLATSKVTFK